MKDASEKRERLVESDSTTEPRELPKTKWRPGCLTYTFAVLLLVLLGGWLGIWLWGLSEQRKFEAEIAAIRERGEPVWFSDLKPDPLPPERDGTEFFLAPTEAHGRIVRNERSATWALHETHLKGTGSGSGGQLSKYADADFANFRAALSECNEAMILFRRALDRGQIQAPRDYQTSQPYNIPLPGVQEQRSFARLLLAEGMLAVEGGNSAEALCSAKDLFRLVDLSREDESIVTQLVRIAIGGIAVNLTSAILENCELTAKQRHELDEILATQEEGFRLRPSMLGERAAMLTSMLNFEETLQDEGFRMSVGMSGMNPWIYDYVPALQYRDMAESVRILEDVLEAFDQTGPSGFQAMQRYEDRIDSLGDSYLLAQVLLPAFARFREAGFRYRQQLRGMRVALRVDAYYRERQKFPETLNEILDDTLPQIPMGTYSELPVIYQVTPDGFKIYDKGTNLVDDGGIDDGEPANVEEYRPMIQIIYPKPDE